MSDLPFATVLRTSRLLLRVPEPADEKAIHLLLTRNSPAATMAGMLPCEDFQGNQKMLARFHRKHLAAEELTWFLYPQAQPDRAIGYVGVFHLSQDEKMAHLGYFLDKRHERRGLMTEALTTVIDNLQERNFSLWAHIKPHNDKSATLARKLGLVHRKASPEWDYWFIAADQREPVTQEVAARA